MYDIKRLADLKAIHLNLNIRAISFIEKEITEVSDKLCN